MPDLYLGNDGNYYDDSGSLVSGAAGNALLQSGANLYDESGDIQYAGAVDLNAIQAGTISTQAQNIISGYQPPAQVNTSVTSNLGGLSATGLAQLITSTGLAIGNTVIASQGRPLTTTINPRTGLVTSSGGVTATNILSSPIMLILLALLAFLLFKRLA